LKYIFGDYAIIHGLFSENQIKSRKLGCFLLDLAFMNCYNEGSGYWPYSYMWSFLLAQKYKLTGTLLPWLKMARALCREYRMREYRGYRLFSSLQRIAYSSEH
jgi:hypothetical protein